MDSNHSQAAQIRRIIEDQPSYQSVSKKHKLNPRRTRSANDNERKRGGAINNDEEEEKSENQISDSEYERRAHERALQEHIKRQFQKKKRNASSQGSDDLKSSSSNS